MDFHDFNDSYDLYDPDYGDDTLALWGESDDSEMGSDGGAGSDDDTEVGLGYWPPAPPQYLGEPWEMPRASTIHRYNEAMDLKVQYICRLHAQQRATATSQSFVLNSEKMTRPG